jgi:fibronectin-binding autotransporter adhesin
MKHRIYSVRGKGSASEGRGMIPCPITILTLMSVFGLFLTATSRASDITWIGGNGSWDTVVNWDAGVAPGPGDRAVFNDSAQTAGYAIGLSVSNEVVGNVLFSADDFGMFVRAGTNTLTVLNSYVLDEPAGTIAVNTLRTGIVAATNSAGTAVFQVGNYGDGGMGLLTMQHQFTNGVADTTITNYPTLIASKFLVTSNSVFVFTAGTLTTYGGSIDYGTDVIQTALSPVAGDIATWNVLGGTNSITYLGAGGTNEFAFSAGGTINFNVSGPNTVLSLGGAASAFGWNGAANVVVSNGGQISNSGTFYVSRNGASSSNNTVTVTGAGSQLIVAGELYMGNASKNNTMTISAGGAVISSTGRVGAGGAGNTNNTVIITGTGSTWKTANFLEVGASANAGPSTLIITNGGQMVNSGTFTRLGNSSLTFNSFVFVDGPGSALIFTNNNISVGNSGASSTVIVKNGGLVNGGFVNIGAGVGSSNNTVLVTDTNSMWIANGLINVGPGDAGNQLTVSNAGKVLCFNGVNVSPTNKAGANVVVSGGTLISTNAGVGAVLRVGGGNLQGMFTLNSGTVTVDQLILTNGAASVFNFNGGVLNVSTSMVANGSVFVVGNGTSAATLNLLPTYSHTYGNGLSISANGTLTGVGAILGNVTLANGAALAPGVSGIGTQTVFGAMVLGSTTAQDFGLGLPGAPQSLVNINGNLTLGGTLNITDVGGFGVGTYTLFTYTGTLTTNGTAGVLTIGATPDPTLTYKIDISTAGLVNLNVTSAAADPFTTWQNHYFGCTACSQAQPSADPNGKGISNTNQFMAGFNPTSTAAYLHVISITKTNADIWVTYLGASGDSTYTGGPGSRTNVLEFTTGTVNGSYSTNNFVSTGQTNILSGGTGLGLLTNMVDSGGATNKPSRFYRVRVLLP